MHQAATAPVLPTDGPADSRQATLTAAASRPRLQGSTKYALLLLNDNSFAASSIRWMVGPYESTPTSAEGFTPLAQKVYFKDAWTAVGWGMRPEQRMLSCIPRGG